MDENLYNPKTYTFEHPKYWGDEELVEEECNNEELTWEELYEELHNLPGANEDNFYGLRRIFTDLGL